MSICVQEDRSRLWTARHKLYYAGINMKPGCRAVTTDACVPVSKLPDMIDQTRKDIDSMGITGRFFFDTFPASAYNVIAGKLS